MVKALSRKRTLQSIDLAWVKLRPKTNFADIGFFTQKPPQPTAEDQDGGDAVLTKVLDKLLQSKSLLHLDLSETGLSQAILVALLAPIKKSPCLVGLHLSGNPGLTPQFQSTVEAQLNATYEPRLQMDSFSQVLNRCNSD